jgi:hypothetical protein
MSRKTAKAYLQLRPSFNNWGERACNGFSIIGLTQKRPQKAVGVIVVELSMSMPLAAFEPLRPVVNIDVPEGVGELRIDASVQTPEPLD